MNRLLSFVKYANKWFIFLALIAVVLFWFLRERIPKEDTTVEYETDNSAELRPVVVEVSEAFIGDLVIRVSATGIAKALQEVTISPKVSGEIVELSGREGARVQKGEPILKLDDRTYRLSLEEAEDNLIKAQAQFVDQLTNFGVQSGEINPDSITRTTPPYVLRMEREYQRIQSLFEQGKSSESDLQQAKELYQTALAFANHKRETIMANRSGLTQAFITEKKARLNLSYTEIRALFSGILGDQEVFIGQQVSPGQSCFKLVNLSRLRVEVNTLESEIGDIRVGSKASVRFAAFPGETFPGKVTAINPIVDPETKTCRVTVEIDNPENKIKSGMFSFVELEARLYRNRFLVPRDAVLIRDERKLVFVVRDGLAKWCYIETGLENEQFVEVLNSAFDLKPEEPVITQGHYTLIHDAPVQVKK